MTNSTRDMQVVLVEDNTADAELTIDALRESHITTNILWLKDGAEAIELLFGEPAANIIQGIKLVLLDLRLPRVNGLDVLPPPYPQRTQYTSPARRDVDLLHGGIRFGTGL